MNKRSITGKRILVTGGTGSFGSLFVEEILRFSPKEVVVFSRDEDKQGLMRIQYKNDSRVRFMLGDIRDLGSIQGAMRGVDVVVHAAALKWITEVEYNVWEGVKTNVIGAQNLIEAARHENVEKVVALSTDKAVEPINAYGMAKALQERLITTANLYSTGTRTIFVSTRYGNVLGSRGSVVPYFRKLISENKPLTITDSSMTRFIMTLKESVALVLFALEEGVGGEVFVPKIKAHTVGDLAEVMLEKKPADERKIEVIGIRPGEKIHETLIGAFEWVRTVEVGPYFVILPQIPIDAVEKKYNGKKRLDKLFYASNTAERLSKEELRQILKEEKFI